MLPQGDAEREHARNGGTLREVPGQPGTRELLIDSRALDGRELFDGIHILTLGAYFHAAEHGPNGEPSGPLDLTDLVYAFQQERRFERWPEDMREYWSRRRDALWKLLELPPEEQWTHDMQTAHQLLLSFVDKLRSDSSPFAGFQEAPEWLVDLVGAFNERFMAVEEQRQRVGREMLATLVTMFDPGVADRTVSASRLADHGLAMHPPRDELELMRDVD